MRERPEQRLSSVLALYWAFLISCLDNLSKRGTLSFMSTLTADSRIPLYHQLADVLRERIRAGQYPAGDRIPSEPELSRTFGIGRPTVRQATDLLVRQRCLERRRGSAACCCAWRSARAAAAAAAGEVCRPGRRCPRERRAVARPAVGPRRPGLEHAWKGGCETREAPTT